MACFSTSGDSTVSTVFFVRIGFEPSNDLHLAVFVLLDHTTKCVSFLGYKFFDPFFLCNFLELLLLHLQDVTGIMQVIRSKTLLFGNTVATQCSISAAGDDGLISVFFDRHSFLCRGSSWPARY